MINVLAIGFIVVLFILLIINVPLVALLITIIFIVPTVLLALAFTGYGKLALALSIILGAIAFINAPWLVFFILGSCLVVWAMASA